MKKFLFGLAVAVLLAVMFTPTVMAADSGLYYDSERVGEGISLHRNGDTVVFYFYTYGHEDCFEVEELEFEEICDEDGQRWFFAADEINPISEVLTGFMYMTHGLDYPFGGFGKVGFTDVIGAYTLKRNGVGEGFRLFVSRFGTVLEPDDFLFSRDFDFNTVLFNATD